jgi:uncharacterized membrane protein YeaQ/YmgE (transglycosylase-associated protein family)
VTLTLPGLILLIVIAAICGAVGRALGGGARGGLFVSTAIGFIGALLGHGSRASFTSPNRSCSG